MSQLNPRIYLSWNFELLGRNHMGLDILITQAPLVSFPLRSILLDYIRYYTAYGVSSYQR